MPSCSLCLCFSCTYDSSAVHAYQALTRVFSLLFSPHDVTVHESSRHTSLDPDSRMHIEVVHPKERVTNSSNENFYPLFHVQLCILKSYKLYLLSRKYATFQYAERRGICFICSVTEHLTNHIEWYRWH